MSKEGSALFLRMKIKLEFVDPDVTFLDDARTVCFVSDDGCDDDPVIVNGDLNDSQENEPPTYH